MEYATGDHKIDLSARITTEGNDLKHTAPHNHAVDVVDTQVRAIQSDMRKRAREEITPVPASYPLLQV